VGLDVEVATRDALEKAITDASTQRDREHVMPYLYAEPGRFRTTIIDLEDDLSRYRWTIDTPQDLEAVRRLWSLLSPDFAWQEAARVSDAHPEISGLNADVVQKQLDVVDERWDA
jgi:spore coat polysaccharide biosynthesis protein SpsF (cytidylyltransferase family)